MSRSVVYSQGGNSVTVLAVTGKSRFQIDTGAGVVESFESRDFIILATNLMLSGAMVTPQRGDRISDTQGSQTFVYEVTGPGHEPCWRWSDPYRTSRRIHTKQVGGP